jgi:tetratricopeptide (TPR) repeat protein
MKRSILVIVVSIYLIAGAGTTLGQNAKDWYETGVMHLSTQNFEKAADAFTKAIELNQEDEYSLIARGTCYLVLNRFPEAIRDYTRVIKLNPQNVDAYFNRGQTYHISGELEKATADYIVAARLGNKKAQEILTKAGIGW